MGTNTMMWHGTAKSVLDLAIVPNTCSADMQVVDVWEGCNVHAALVMWTHVTGENMVDHLDYENVVVGQRPKVWKLTAE